MKTATQMSLGNGVKKWALLYCSSLESHVLDLHMMQVSTCRLAAMLSIKWSSYEGNVNVFFSLWHQNWFLCLFAP
jgi:hypothetical protein